MTQTKKKQDNVGSKTAIEPEVVNAEVSLTTGTRTNFQMVAVGICPHDNEKLGDEIRGRGVGVTRTCKTCGHTWYINKKIRTCKCLECHGVKRKSMERLNTSRNIQNTIQNNGGPKCTIDRTFKLVFSLDAT